MSDLKTYNNVVFFSIRHKPPSYWPFRGRLAGALLALLILLRPTATTATATSTDYRQSHRQEQPKRGRGNGLFVVLGGSTKHPRAPQFQDGTAPTYLILVC